MKTSIQALVASAVVAIAGGAIAAPQSIGFAEVPLDSFSSSNMIIDGYRFSPTCHIDKAENWPGSTDGVAIGWDVDACDLHHNENYLGIKSWSGFAVGALYVDRAGKPFDLMSFTAIGFDYITGPGLISSKGGSALFSMTSGERREFSFTGDEWTGIEWLVLLNGGGAPNWWLDSVTLNSVPEPTSLALTAVAAAAAVGRRRHQRRQN